MPGIEDVARHAKVSVTTVSRVLNNKSNVSQKTKDKVAESIKILNYHPSQIARSLFTNRTHLIGIVIPDISHSFFAEMTKYIEINLNKFGYKLLLCNTIEETTRVKDYIDMLQQNKVDGIIIGSHNLDIQEYTNINLPIVALDQFLSSKIPIISANHEQGGMLAANELINNGCKNIVQICGCTRVRTPSNARHKSFERVLSTYGLSCNTIELGWNKFSFEDYVNVVSKMFDENPNIDGFFSVDNVAAEVLKQAFNRSISVPEELKIVGYDGTAFAHMMNPPLTTIKQPITELCISAVKTLIDLIDKKEIENYIIKSDVVLIKGGTTL